MPLFGYTHTQVESPLYSVEQTAGGIELHRNANKTENMYFKREAVLST